MAVFKRKAGKRDTEHYHYKFMKEGKYYFGVCEGCRTKKDAEDFEKALKKKTTELAVQRSAKALVENFRNELAGGTKVPLMDAFDLALKKPARRQASPRHVEGNRAYWRDFCSFMAAHFPEVVNLADVRKVHAEEYIQHLREHGRFDKAVTYNAGDRAKGYVRNGTLSPRSVNAFQVAIAAVFNKLTEDAGLLENPFKHIIKQESDPEAREAFSRDELALISQNLNPFVRPIFVIGATTGLREGDICTLRWAEVDRDAGFLVRKTMKTGALVDIPITPPLAAFLDEQERHTGKDEFVLPEHAAMYKANPSGVTYRFKRFLEGLGIKTTRKAPGRTRSVSVKDVHSLRHTFCYFAGVHGIPLNIVQSIVGHMTPEMTRHYQAHADRKTKHAMMEKMPDLLALPVASLGDKNEALRRETAALLERATTDQLKAIIKMLTS